MNNNIEQLLRSPDWEDRIIGITLLKLISPDAWGSDLVEFGKRLDYKNHYDLMWYYFTFAEPGVDFIRSKFKNS